jgi:hypothetical protein
MLIDQDCGWLALTLEGAHKQNEAAGRPLARSHDALWEKLTIVALEIMLSVEGASNAIHVDTGFEQFDHHQSSVYTVS